MSGVSNRLIGALLATIVAAGAMLILGRMSSDATLDEPTFPLPLVTSPLTTSVTTWQPPPQTRNPFVVDGLESADLIDDEVVDALTSTTATSSVAPAVTNEIGQVTTTVDTRPLEDVISSRVPTTTSPPNAPTSAPPADSGPTTSRATGLEGN